MTWLLFIVLLFGDDQTVFQPADFQRIVEQFLQENLRQEGIDAELTFKSLPKQIVLPKGSYSLRAAQRQPMAKKGYCGIPVEVVRDGVVERTVLCSVFIRTFQDVYVSLRTFGKNEQLDPSFLIVKRIETTSMDDVVVTASDVRGLRTKRMVTQNSVLRMSLVEEVPAVFRDQAVSLLVKVNNITIGASGIAKGDGKIGDEITVQRTGTKEIVRAKVVGQQIVEIDVR